MPQFNIIIRVQYIYFEQQSPNVGQIQGFFFQANIFKEIQDHSFVHNNLKMSNPNVIKHDHNMIT